MATLDHAYDPGVGAVVLYLGSMDILDQTRGFCGLYRSGKIAEEEGLAFREGQKRTRKASKEKKPGCIVLLSLEGLKFLTRAIFEND